MKAHPVVVAVIVCCLASTPASARQECRTVPSASTTVTTFATGKSIAKSKCSYNKSTNEATCISEYSDTLGTSSVSTSATTFKSLDDFLAEVQVNPPLRRSTATVTTTRGKSGLTKATVTYSYDAQKRVTREVLAGGSTTTWSSWDGSGRPTAGSTAVKGGIRTIISVSYDDASRSFTRTEGAAGQSMTCTMTFDANGNPELAVCKGALGVSSRATTKTTATERICR
jgi:YD repeat-containing protein